MTNRWLSFLALAVILLTPVLFAATTSQIVDTDFSRGTFYINTAFNMTMELKVSTTAPMLYSPTGNNDKADLADGDIICPGQITAAFNPLTKWAASSTFDATTSFPLSDWYAGSRPQASQGKTYDVSPIWSSSIYSQMTMITAPPSLATSLAPQVNEEVMHYADAAFTLSQLGNAPTNFFCQGSVDVRKNSAQVISGYVESVTPFSFTGADGNDVQLTSNMNVNCRGAIHQLPGTTSTSESEFIYQPTTGLPFTFAQPLAISLHVRDPHAITPAITGVNVSSVNIGSGASTDVEFTIQNPNDVGINIASESATNGFTITGLAGWRDTIPPNSVAKRDARISATQAYSGSFNVTLDFISAVPVCDGSYLHASANFTISNNGGPKACTLNSSSIVAAQYNVSRGGSYPVQAQCTDDNGAPIDCGNGFVWTTTLDGGAMDPATTIIDPHISNLTVSLTAPNQTGKDITATYTGSPAFSCSLQPLHSIAVGPDQNVTGCSLSCPDIIAHGNQVEIGKNYTIQTICLNQFGTGVVCNKDFNWSTTIINATMEPNTTTRPVDTSTLVVSPDATNQTGKNVNVTDATGDFTCNFPAGLSVVYPKSCTIGAPSTVQLNAEVLPTVTFTFPFNADIQFDCGYGSEITLACNSTASQATSCQPKNPAVDKCQYVTPSIGYTMTAAYSGATCTHAIKLTQQTSCNYYI